MEVEDLRLVILWVSIIRNLFFVLICIIIIKFYYVLKDEKCNKVWNFVLLCLEGKKNEVSCGVLFLTEFNYLM